MYHIFVEQLSTILLICVYNVPKIYSLTPLEELLLVKCNNGIDPSSYIMSGNAYNHWAEYIRALI